MVGCQSDLDVSKGSAAHDAAIAIMDHRRNFHDVAIGRFGRDGSADQAAALFGFHCRCIRSVDIGCGISLTGNGQLLAAVERRKKGNAHEGTGSDAGQESSGKPADRDFAAVRRFSAIGQKRFVFP